MAEYCEDKDGQRFADCPVLFSTIRGYKNVIESQTEVLLLFQAADIRLKDVTPSDQNVHTLTLIWAMYDQEKELYRAVKFVLKDRCSEILNQVPTGRGYELLWLLALKYDRVMPHLREVLLF